MGEWESLVLVVSRDGLLAIGLGFLLRYSDLSPPTYLRFSTKITINPE